MAPQATENSDRNAPLALTHGEEHEFLAAFVWEGEEDPDQNTANMPPLLIIPKPSEPAEKGSFGCIENERDYASRLIHAKMRQTLRDHQIPVKDGDEEETADETPAVRFGRFDIVGDASVTEKAKAYSWCGVELRTPANLDTLAAYDVSRYALNMLKLHYRLMVNKNCGFHCHVGLGSQSYNLSDLKRIAGFLWAADPLLSCLHPPERRPGPWCQSVRIRSTFNQAAPDQPRDHARARERCIRYHGQDVRFGEHPAEWRLRNRTEADVVYFERTRQFGHHEPYLGIPTSHYDDRYILPMLGDSSSSGDGESSSEDEHSLASTQRSNREPSQLEVDSPRTSLEDSDDSLCSPGLPAVPFVRRRRIGRVGLPRSEDEGVQGRLDGGALPGLMRIQACRSACEIANGFDWTNNYNLHHYHCHNLFWRGAPLRTIEFREAAGTLDGAWAMLWSRICVGLVRWALQSPGAQFHEVIMKCDHASRSPGGYDVVDLLDDMGMVSEAGLVEKRLEENMAEWGYVLDAQRPVRKKITKTSAQSLFLLVDK